MNSQVTDWELVLILLASVFTILLILTIVSRWLNFHLLSTCVNWSRNRKVLRNTSSFADNTTQEPTASFIDLNIINEPVKSNHEISLWTPGRASVSSLITNDTTYDDVPPMPNSTSAYDIVSYANNVKSTLTRTISCDSDELTQIGSLNEIYLHEENVGIAKLQITINYNALEEYLEISFLQVRDLIVSEQEKNSFDVYLFAWLDQDRKQSQKTDSILYQKNPSILFNASMKWKVNDDQLTSTVLHTNLYKREENLQLESMLGECSFTIGEIYIYQPLTTWLNLYQSDQICRYLGEISVSLCYHPTADRLTCSLIQARNLTFHQQESFNNDKISIDCYATISLLDRRRLIKKTRTNFHHATDRNPVFNESSVFQVSTNDLLTAYIRIVIYQNIPSSMTSSQTVEIGHCLIGNHDRSQPTCHWQQMLRVLRRPVIVWHPLKL